MLEESVHSSNSFSVTNIAGVDTVQTSFFKL